MSEDHDAGTVRRVLAGDVDAFEEIVRRWQGPLLRLAWRFSGDRHRAEEMAQEAFMTAFRSLHRWRGEGAFSSWLFAVATNACRSFLRRLPPEAALAEDPPARAAPVERHERVQRAVRALPGRYRDAVVLFYFHGMNVHDAARSLGLPEGTLKARLHRARALLKAALGDQEDL
jgi:RNA polymerase sigma-70 factor (ECF subfamily)